ncbi:MAG: hypothetical protein GX270_16220 [Clostridiaceae bacterium]|nr:hypothetical protein [Clostridiaceae bacterium]
MVFAWENIGEVTYRSEIINGQEVIYPKTSNRGTLKTADFDTVMSKSFVFCKSDGSFYEIEDFYGMNRLY